MDSLHDDILTETIQLRDRRPRLGSGMRANRSLW